MTPFDISASTSLATSASSGLSGATEQGGPWTFGGTSYGPGSLILTNTDQRGSIGANAGTGGNLLSWLALGGILLVGVMLIKRLKRK